MKIAFEARFKNPNNECTLLLQLIHLKRKVHDLMWDCAAKFNRLLQRISIASRPSDEIKKIFFLNVVLLDLSFQMLKDVVADLVATYRQEI